MTTARVGDIAEQVRGVTFSKADAVDSPRHGYLPVLTAGNIQGAELITNALTYVPSRMVRDKQHVQTNDVVVCTSSGSLTVVGKAARSRGDFTGGFGAFLKVLRPSPEVDPAYFAHFFQTPGYRRRVSALAVGANINNLKNEHLDDFVLPLPSLSEQRRIAAILDHADALRAKRRQVLAHLDSLSQSIFHDMFGDPRTWSTLWPIGVIGDMVESAQYGTSAKSGSTGAWPILRMGNITDLGRLDLSDLKYGDLSERDVPKYSVRRGDLLFNRTNSKEKVGKTCVVETDEPLAIAGYLVRIRLAPGHQSHFVSAYLTSPVGVKIRQRMAKAAVNQANINPTEMQRIPIALPDPERQMLFADRVRAVEVRRAALLNELAAHDELFASLQSRAFRGEL